MNGPTGFFSKHPVSRETGAVLERFVALLRSEAENQNLISSFSAEQLWQRHIVDCAQLVRFSEPRQTWIDVGSGAGMPGLVLAIIGHFEMTLVEPRRLRSEFLLRAVGDLKLPNVRVLASKAQSISGSFDRITARAVAPLTKLLGITVHLAHPQTLWVLPKGRNAKSELAEAERSWQYDLRVEPSCTDADSSILLLSNVRAKRKP